MPRCRSLVLAGAALMLSMGAAQAQSRCGPTYEIRPGDTLYSVAQRCRVALAQIADWNPGLEPRDLAVGQRIRLSAGTDGGGQTGEGGYRVRPGDTMYSIARRFGLSLIELLRANEDVDPFDLAVNTLLDLPGDAPRGTVSLSRPSGAPGSQLRFSASGLRPDDWVTLGVGRQASDWRPLRQAKVGPRGKLSGRLTVPTWAEPGEDLIFVIDTDRGVTLKSGAFEVTAAPERGARVSLEGRVRSGVECPSLVTPDGDTWALVGGEAEAALGDYVEVEGRLAETAFCQQGVGTVAVSAIREIDAPGGGQGGAPLSLEGRVRSGVECPVLVTPEGETWSLTGDMDFTAGEYVEVQGSRAAMSFCMQGVGTVNVARIREVEPPARDRDAERGGARRLTAAHAAGAWTVQGGDCDRPDFAITWNSAGGLVVETSLNGSPRTGYVRLGDDAAFVFDQPRRVMELESRGPDGLAVMPPSDGPVDLGGRPVAGSGRVFVKCG